MTSYLEYWSSMPKTTAYSYRSKHTDIDVFKRRIVEHAALSNVRLLDDHGATTFQDFYQAMPRGKRPAPSESLPDNRGLPDDCGILDDCGLTDEEIYAAVTQTRAQLNAVDQQLADVDRQIERIEKIINKRF